MKTSKLLGKVIASPPEIDVVVQGRDHNYTKVYGVSLVKAIKNGNEYYEYYEGQPMGDGENVVDVLLID